ncbi:hypothetical protein PITCH_A1470004 [uncultured Desulfobacterium sp.]|uniref:Type II toxin-antitoxin system HicA family toxin n=1 Tax=uncultured Desulfobacterium sp. TaxID=201089 RepID=A0A445MT87_9BACT|nr:hypothetical protein PITCH_A1470004 [uncultured Desulfobacterium sp.]
MPKLSEINHQRAIREFEKADFWVARKGKHITIIPSGRRLDEKSGRNEYWLAS